MIRKYKDLNGELDEMIICHGSDPNVDWGSLLRDSQGYLGLLPELSLIF